MSPEEAETLKHQKMMTRGAGCKVRVIGFEGKEKPGEVRIQSFNLAMKLWRAVKLLGICWGLAAISVILPIAHFILVPGFFIAGLVLGASALMTRSLVLGGEGLCPNCDRFLPIRRKKDKWPLTGRCDECHTDLEIQKLPA